MNTSSPGEYPLRTLCTRWTSLLNLADKQKDDRFGKYAKEAYEFYNGDHDWMWQEEYAAGPDGYLESGEVNKPTFKMTVNRIFEAVAMFGPALMFRNPQSTVTANNPPEIDPFVFGVDPENPQYEEMMMGQRQASMHRDTTARIGEHYLDWLQLETDKKGQARRAVTEAVVKGLGCLMTELHTPIGSEISYPRTKFISCDDYNKDPDARHPEEVLWISVKRRESVNKAEMRFGLAPGTLKGHMQSRAAQATKAGKQDAEMKRDTGSHDTIEYTEIFSKNGMGEKLSSMKPEDMGGIDWSFVGPYAWIVVSEGVPFPLNLPPEKLTDQETVKDALAWPIPFWTDDSLGKGWPVTEIGFWEDPNSVWPISLIKPAIGEVRFVNWCMSFLADKTAQACTDYIGVMKSAAQDIQEQLVSGSGPYKVIEIAELSGRSIKDIVSFLEKPQFSMDIWRMVESVLEMIDKRTGLTELVFGLSGRQMRSATEASVRQDNVSVRPEDMAQTVETALGECLLKEWEAAVWLLNPQDVAPIIGPLGALFWQQTINQMPFDAVVREFSFKIAANSARIPNKAQKVTALAEVGQMMMPIFQQQVAIGDVEGFNNFVSDMAQAMDLEPRYQVNAPPPPEEQGPSPEEQKAELEIQKRQAEFQFDVAEKQMELSHADDVHNQELDHSEEEHDEQLAFLTQTNRIKGLAARQQASRNGNN